jgi:nucleoside recognition membrane protein YjiH
LLNDILVQLVFGFPAGVISLCLSALGIWKKWILWLVIAGILTVPFTFYLTVASGLPLYLMALFQFGAAYAVKKQKTGLAWGQLLPLALTTLFMAYLTFFAFFESRGL